MTISSQFGFYAILTDPMRGYEYCTKLLIDYEVAFVQLRMKDASDEDVLTVAKKMRSLTLGTKTRFIVNDNPSIAKLAKADGTHLGQSDMVYSVARNLVGETSIIGISTHSVEQVKNTCKLNPNYIGMGPVYATPTKKNPDPVIGLTGLQKMLSVATVPAVAIGGISFDTLPLILEAGAKNFCMVRPITATNNPEKALKKILKIYQSYNLPKHNHEIL